MSNVLKYIKDLEAAGFQRIQAEAQVQVVLDALEGDLVTKSDFAAFKSEFADFKSEFADFKSEFSFFKGEFYSLKNEFNVFKEHVDNRFSQFQHDINNRFDRVQSDMDIRFTQVYSQIKESEFRTVTRLGVLVVSTTSLAVALMAWLIKV